MIDVRGIWKENSFKYWRKAANTEEGKRGWRGQWSLLWWMIEGVGSLDYRQCAPGWSDEGEEMNAKATVACTFEVLSPPFPSKLMNKCW